MKKCKYGYTLKTCGNKFEVPCKGDCELLKVGGK